MKRQSDSIMKIFQHTAVAVCITCLSTTVLAQQAIRSVTGSLQGGAEVLRVDLSEPLAGAPTGFATQSPARIALDFPGASNATGKTSVDINQGNLKSANVVEAGGRSRIVLNLKQPTSYRAEIQGNALLIMLDPVSASTVAPTQQAAKFADSYNNEVLKIGRAHV